MRFKCASTFSNEADADKYCRRWNDAELRRRAGYWAIPLAVQTARQPSRRRSSVVVVVSRDPRQDRVLKTFGPLTEEVAESLAAGFDAGNKDRDRAVAVAIDFSSLGDAYETEPESHFGARA